MNTLTSIALFATIATLSTLRTDGAEPQTTAPAPAEHERVLNRFLRSFNGGDRAALTEFAATCLTEAARRGRSAAEVAQNDLDLRDQVGGGFDVCRIEKNAGPELVARRGMGETAPPADLLPPRQSPASLGVEIDAKLTRMAQEDRFSGTVMIARNGKPVWQKAYGFADRDAKTANNLDTRFRLGSMNKMITSVAIAQLVEAGKLKYTETLAEALPDYPEKEVAQKITLHHLLTHTSGLGDIFTPEFDKKKESLHEIKDYLPLFVHQPLRFAPGAGWSYSNAGFVVLGLVIENSLPYTYSGKRMTGNPKPAQMCKPSVRQCSSQIKPI